MICNKNGKLPECNIYIYIYIYISVLFFLGSSGNKFVSQEKNEADLGGNTIYTICKLYTM